VIGDREEITQLPLEAMPGVDRVVAILKPYKLVGRDSSSATPSSTCSAPRSAAALRHHRRTVFRGDSGAGAGRRPRVKEAAAT